MPIQFKPVLKSEPGIFGGGNKKYYASIVYDKPFTMDQMVKEIEKFSSLSEPDIRGVLIALENVIQDKLCDGRIIRFDRLGNFYPSIHSNGVATEEEVGATIIKKITIGYRPGDRLKASLKTAKFTKVSSATPNAPITPEPEPKPEPEP